ncbi:DUF6049 family protein [Streptomyces sp. NPDC050504]|uniref:DUF6049 family protein n=1 Tax=Streptomyces sp. NPDC050504 TaxID=3365618 RepID=UPI0037B4C8FC
MAEAADIQGMNPSPARRWVRRTAALVAGAPILAALIYGPAAKPATAATAAEKDTGPRVDVSLDSLMPAAPVKGDTVTVSGTLTNKGKETVTNAHVDLRVGRKLSGRIEIDDAAARTGSSSDDLSSIEDKYSVKVSKLASGISTDFSISVPVDKLGLDGDGVYQLGVSLSGETADEDYDHVLGSERTFLPWQPSATGKKSQFTYLWPLISSVHLTAETGSDEQQTPVFEDEALAAELAPGGRLEQMVSLGSQLPVTWVIDPDLLASVDAMTKSYRVKSDDTTVAGKNQAVARQWLTALETAVQGRKVVALPFGDPDLASLAHHGVSGSLSHLQPATEVAEMTVETVLHVKPSVDFAWPVDGAIDPSIVNVATSAGAHKVIARSDSLRETAGLPYTPTAARPIGGGTTAVVSDARLSTAFQGDMTDAENSTLAVQEFLAQSLAFTLQEPDKQRSIVVAPQRMPTAAQAQSMAQALRTLEAQRWTQPLDLVAASAVKPDPKATTKVPSTARYPKKLRADELTDGAFQQIRTVQGTLDTFKGILTQPDRVVTPFGNAINREMSTSWRGHEAEATRYRDSVQMYLSDLTSEVKLIDKSDVTLSGRSATIPVTVQNKLVQGVDNLVLRLKSDTPRRLTLDDGKVVSEEPIKISGGHRQTVKFDTSANANGQARVTAQLYTADNLPYGKEMTFTVKVSEITPTVMLVIAGGVLLLVLAGVRMYTQRKRTAATAAAAREDAEAERKDTTEAPDDTTGSGQPSDPTPDTGDTGPESGDPSGAGEKVDR